MAEEHRRSIFGSDRAGMWLSLYVLGWKYKDRRGTCGTSIILCLDIDVHPSRVEDRGIASSKEMKDKAWTQAISPDCLHWLIVNSLAFSWTAPTCCWQNEAAPEKVAFSSIEMNQAVTFWPQDQALVLVPLLFISITVTMKTISQKNSAE